MKRKKIEIQESDFYIIFEEVQRNIPLEIQIHPKFKNVEEEIKSNIENKISISIKEFKPKIYQEQIYEIKEIIDKKLDKLYEKETSRMDQTKDLEIDKILPKDNIKNIKKNIFNTIDNIISKNKYSEYVKTQIQKYIKDKISKKIENIRIKVTSLSNTRKEEMKNLMAEIEINNKKIKELEAQLKENEENYKNEINDLNQKYEDEKKKYNYEYMYEKKKCVRKKCVRK